MFIWFGRFLMLLGVIFGLKSAKETVDTTEKSAVSLGALAALAGIFWLLLKSKIKERNALVYAGAILAIYYFYNKTLADQTKREKNKTDDAGASEWKRGKVSDWWHNMFGGNPRKPPSDPTSGSNPGVVSPVTDPTSPYYNLPTYDLGVGLPQHGLDPALPDYFGSIRN